MTDRSCVNEGSNSGRAPAGGARSDPGAMTAPGQPGVHSTSTPSETEDGDLEGDCKPGKTDATPADGRVGAHNPRGRSRWAPRATTCCHSGGFGCCRRCWHPWSEYPVSPSSGKGLGEHWARKKLARGRVLENHEKAAERPDGRHY